MEKRTQWVQISLILITVAVFVLFVIPNAKASENIQMVSMFEPDEGIIVPVIKSMISPKDNFKYFLIHFFTYEYYYYGFPFFGSSAFVALVIQWANQLDNLPLLMLSLRQLISVLPMLLALLMLVYMHDRFTTYRSILLYLFLLLVPAVVRNGFWWHPDGLVLLLSTIVLYLLYSDDHKLGWRFLGAAFFCGILTATKLVGGYFFLAVGLAVIWALVLKKVTWKVAVLKSIAFLVIMVLTFVLANPFLIFEAHRTLYINTFRKQTDLLSLGYGVIYEKGLLAAWPTMQEYFGEAIFLIATLGLTLWNIAKKETRFLHVLILAWFIPLTVSLLTFSHFKFQYWLPVAVPLFCNWITVFPWDKWKINFSSTGRIVKAILLAIFLVQFILFGVQSTRMTIERANRKETSAEIGFYDLALGQLEPIKDKNLYVYFDYRLYLPHKGNWVTETSFDLLDYEFIQSRNFDVLFLLQQRIWDYLQPSAVGIDPEAFARSQAFYQDAEDGSIAGYELLFRNETALVYVREDLCLQYFEPGTCQ